DQDRRTVWLTDRAGDLGAVGGERYRRAAFRAARVGEVPGPGLGGRTGRHLDEAAEFVFPVVPAQVPEAAVFLVAARLDSAVGRHGVVGALPGQARGQEGETGRVGLRRLPRGNVPPRQVAGCVNAERLAVGGESQPVHGVVNLDRGPFGAVAQVE